MFKWLRAKFKLPEPAGPAQDVAVFNPPARTIAQETIVPEAAGWRVDFSEDRTLGLFEVPAPGDGECLLTYRADLKTQGVQGRIYLEMWCRVPGRGEFFSKGFHNALKGSNDWASYEIPFYLKRGQTPDLVKLDLTVEGRGTAWIRNVKLLRTPLRPAT